ncbi:hypothetical protein APUTEX25_002473 [Auxenochlorella protothecoides]|uniref:Uncharacterized protein n=1 Tax=Auxenochlorella protothecoides TaxID=3075 RepID=A0A3M7L0I0_AUXPR|nr:hypothetical protein APUTEX25_002473 [Auxenochlorella protothecoides]|eukprot:RMZ56283.1 hypothetical protein APUTEX25_002473 [Auxenochlorella protothecoides]
MGFIEEGLDRMWAAVQEGEEAVASRGKLRGFIATFKAGNSRKGGDGPVPVSDPPHGTSADLGPYSLEPDTQGLDRAPDPHLADSNGTPTPLMGIPGNLAPIIISLVAKKGRWGERDALYKFMTEAVLPVMPAWLANPTP